MCSDGFFNLSFEWVDYTHGIDYAIGSLDVSTSLTKKAFFLSLRNTGIDLDRIKLRFGDLC